MQAVSKNKFLCSVAEAMVQVTNSGVSKWIIYFTSPQGAGNITQEIPRLPLGINSALNFQFTSFLKIKSH